MVAYQELESLSMLQDGLDGSLKRHSAISNNLANVNTPGYKRKEVAFKDELARAYMGEGPPVEMHKAHPKHMTLQEQKPVEPNVYEVNNTNMRNDKNNVDPDKQMAKLAKNTLYFNGISRLVSQQFQRMQGVLSDLRQQ